MMSKITMSTRTGNMPVTIGFNDVTVWTPGGDEHFRCDVGIDEDDARELMELLQEHFKDESTEAESPTPRSALAEWRELGDALHAATLSLSRAFCSAAPDSDGVPQSLESRLANLEARVDKIGSLVVPSGHPVRRGTLPDLDRRLVELEAAVRRAAHREGAATGEEDRIYQLEATVEKLAASVADVMAIVKW